MLDTLCVPYDPPESEKQLTDQTTQLQARLNRFFSASERRAFQMARYALGNTEDALDVVQEAMMGLVEKYSARPDNEWQPLFYTILQSRIRDRQRRNTVRQRFNGLLSLFHKDDESIDPFQEAPDMNAHNPEQNLLSDDTGAAIEQALQKLPYRQQQAFLLRIWEGLSVRQTAAALGCSEGTVKTHLSRAMTALRDELGDIYHEQ